jgi:hypothetical protein
MMGHLFYKVLLSQLAFQHVSTLRLRLRLSAQRLRRLVSTSACQAGLAQAKAEMLTSARQGAS